MGKAITIRDVQKQCVMMQVEALPMMSAWDSTIHHGYKLYKLLRNANLVWLFVCIASTSFQKPTFWVKLKHRMAKL